MSPLIRAFLLRLTPSITQALAAIVATFSEGTVRYCFYVTGLTLYGYIADYGNI